MEKSAEVTSCIVRQVELGWMPLSPDGIAMCRGCGVETKVEGEGSTGTTTNIGGDLAKVVSKLHGAAENEWLDYGESER